MENIILLILGVFISVVGIINMTGNISTIHSYNRRKVADKDVPKYGRAVGIGTLIIGIGAVAQFVLNILNLSTVGAWILTAAVVAGLAFILYAQFKYNKGIF